MPSVCKFLYDANPKWWNYLVFLHVTNHNLNPCLQKQKGMRYYFIKPTNMICKWKIHLSSHFVHMLWVFYRAGNWMCNYHSWWVAFLHRIRVKSLIGFEPSSKVRKMLWFLSPFSILTLSYSYLTTSWGAMASETKLMNKKTYFTKLEYLELKCSVSRYLCTSNGKNVLCVFLKVAPKTLVKQYLNISPSLFNTIYSCIKTVTVC